MKMIKIFNLPIYTFKQYFNKTYAKCNNIFLRLMKGWLDDSYNFMVIDSLKNGDNCLYRHVITGTILQCKFLELHSRDYQTFRDMAEWRNRTQYPINKIYYVELINQIRQGCNIKIYHQKCQYLLSNQYNLALEQALYILTKSLIAIQQIFKKFGSFYLTSKMIGVNSQQQCKIWMNQQFQQNRIKKNQLKQQTQITKLLHIVEEHTVSNTISKKLFEEAINFSETFELMKKFIKQFCQKNNLIIPHKYEFSELKESAFTAQSTVLSKKCLQLKLKVESNFQTSLTSFKSLDKYSIKRTSIVQSIAINQQSNKKPLQISRKSNLLNRNQNRQSNFSFVNYKKNSSNCRSMGMLTNFQQNNISFKKPELQIKKQNNYIVQAPKIKPTMNKYILQKFSNHKNQSKINKRYQPQKYFNKITFDTLNWKKTLSKLFSSSQQNLIESINLGIQQKVYLKDLRLEKLGQFGRYVNNSQFQQNEDQQSQFVQKQLQLL